MELNVPTPLVRVLSAGNIADPSVLVKCTVPEYPVAVPLLKLSAVMVKLNATPGVADAGAEMAKCVAAVLVTVIVLEVPVMELVTVSVAVMVWLPAVFSVELNVPTPLVKVLLAGNMAAPSVLVKCTVPLYPIAVQQLLQRNHRVTAGVAYSEISKAHIICACCPSTHNLSSENSLSMDQRSNRLWCSRRQREFAHKSI